MKAWDTFIPDSHKHCVLNSFDWTAMEELEQLVKDTVTGKRKKGLCLIGNPGTGKTHILIGVFKELIKNGKYIGQDVIYLDWSTWIREILSLMQYGTPEKIIETGCNANIILIDDVRPFSGKIWNDCLKLCIESVYENKKTLLITCNANSIDDIVKLWNIEDYWVSRLISVTDIVLVVGKDRRLNE